MRATSFEKNCSICNLSCIFAGLQADKESDSNHYKREIVFKKGETIFKQGTFVSKIIFIQEGLVKIVIEGSAGKDFLVKLSGSQSYLGLTQAFGTNESKYTAISLKEARICMIEVNFFKRQILKNTSLGEKMFQIASEEHDFLYNRLGIIGTKNLHGRLADALMYLCSEGLARENVFDHLTRKDLSDLTCMSVESLVRLLNEFKHDKIITMSGKQIEINNLEMIRILYRAG